MKKNKPNKFLILLAVVTTLLAIGVVYYCLMGNRPKTTEINLATLTEKMENDESFVLFIGSSICGACESFTPTLNRIIEEHDVTIFYIDVHDLSSEENSDLLALINYQSRTPRLYFIEDGEYSQYNMISGARSYNDVLEKMQKNGYIK